MYFPSESTVNWALKTWPRSHRPLTSVWWFLQLGDRHFHSHSTACQVRHIGITVCYSPPQALLEQLLYTDLQCVLTGAFRLSVKNGVGDVGTHSAILSTVWLSICTPYLHSVKPIFRTPYTLYGVHVCCDGLGHHHVPPHVTGRPRVLPPPESGLSCAKSGAKCPVSLPPESRARGLDVHTYHSSSVIHLPTPCLSSLASPASSHRSDTLHQNRSSRSSNKLDRLDLLVAYGASQGPCVKSTSSLCSGRSNS